MPAGIDPSTGRPFPKGTEAHNPTGVLVDGGTSPSQPLAAFESNLPDGGVTTAKLGAKAVTTAKIDDLAVTSAQLAALAVTSAKLSTALAPLASLASTLDALGRVRSLSMAAALAFGAPADPANDVIALASARRWGAKADAINVADGAITTGLKALTSASALFTAADVGKSVRVAGAGAAGADLFTTIATFVSAGSVTTTAAAGTTVTNASTTWGTDNGPIFQAAVNALAGTGVALWIPAGGYVVATPVVMPSNIEVRGSKGAIIWASMAISGAQTSSVFNCFAPAPVGQGTISTTPTVGSKTVLVNGWSGVAPTVGNVLILAHGLTQYSYDVRAVSGAGPYTLTLDRAIAVPFVSTDVANTYTTQPHDITIRGLRFRGPCDRFIELGCVRHARINCDADTVGGGGPESTQNGAFSFDTGSRDVGYEGGDIDLYGLTGSQFGVAFESVDGGFAIGVNVYGGNTGFYTPDCNAVTLTGCYASACGIATGSGSGFSFGSSTTGLGSYGVHGFGCVAVGCYYGATITAVESSSLHGFEANACTMGLNVNSAATSVEVFGFHAPRCTSILLSAANLTIHGLRAPFISSAPSTGLISIIGGTFRLYDAVISATATTFVASVIRATASAIGVEVYDSTFTTADASFAHGIYASVGTIKVRGFKLLGSAQLALRFDSGGVGYIGEGCDLSGASDSRVIYSSDNLAWHMTPQGGVAAISMADTNKTATWAQSVCSVVQGTGAITADRTLTMVRDVGRVQTFVNLTTGAHNLVISYGTGTTVSIAPAGITRVYFDGTNAVAA